MKPLNDTVKHWLKRRSKGRMPDLGARELSVLELMWTQHDCSSQDVHAALPGRDISLSTVQSTLERLCRKGLVSRSKQGRAYRYRAELSREQLIGGLMRDLADDLAGGRLAPMVSGFIEYVADASGELPPELVCALRRPEKDGE